MRADLVHLRLTPQVTAFHVDEFMTMAAPRNRRRWSCGAAPNYLTQQVDYLFGATDAAPSMPAGMRTVCRRERKVRVGSKEPSWKWSNQKLLSFQEDIRLPYYGTLTAICKPLTRTRTPTSARTRAPMLTLTLTVTLTPNPTLNAHANEHANPKPDPQPEPHQARSRASATGSIARRRRTRAAA